VKVMKARLTVELTYSGDPREDLNRVRLALADVLSDQPGVSDVSATVDHVVLDEAEEET
jgi:hypothetical protein